MKLRLTSLVLLLALIGTFGVFAPRQAAAAKGEVRANVVAGIPIQGTLNGAAFAGTLNITQFVLNQATGQLSVVGEIRNAAGTVIGELRAVVNDVVNPGGGKCDILHLELGPITVDLLGLVITTNRIVLDVDAQPGPGNLLGNLLCSVARLLDNGGPLSNLLRLLDRINNLL